MFGLNPIPFYIIIGLICTNLFAGGMWWLNSVESEAYQTKLKTCQGQHLVFVNKTKAEGEIAAAHTKQKEKEDAKIAKDTVDGWAAALAVVRSDAVTQRMRDAARRSAGSSAVPKVSGDRPGDAVPESDSIPPPARVAQDCAETTITLNYLQSYVERLQNE